MPSVQRVHEALKDQEVVVLAISIDGGGEKAVQAFLKKHSYTVAMPVDARMDTARKFGVRGLPTTYVINRQGTVVAHGLGAVALDTPEFMQYLTALAAQPRESWLKGTDNADTMVAHADDRHAAQWERALGQLEHGASAPGRR